MNFESKIDASISKELLLNAGAWQHLGLTPPAGQAVQLPLLDEDF